MIRDPFYQEIITRLNGTLDPELFERCATDLLQSIHPTLVPVRGGSDGGMDGAVADEGGLTFPLTCTTRKDVIGNMRHSLETYLSDGGLRRNVIVATSQALTPRRRKNLEKEAACLGFTLVQIHDQASIGNLLYRRPEWSLELLNLSGKPLALSVLPISIRPLIDLPLIGRDIDLSWLKETDGDLLLVGQPGSGKTFLLHVLAKEGEGLFVNSDDMGEIASGIRAQAPKVLIVDDAHLRTGLLARLRQLRTEIGADFRIIANCWPGSLGNVATALDLSQGSIRQLDLLTRDQMVEVVNAVGIGGPNALIREIVDQANGRPGLATTLSHICLKGDVNEVAFGEALSRDIKTALEPLVGKEATHVLAAFSVGGSAGLLMTAVAENLGLALSKVRVTATQLAAGGVLNEINQQALSVQPARLRHALVRDVFFKGAASLPVDDLISNASNLHDVTMVLIGSRALGGKVPDGLLHPLLERADSNDAWEAFAWLGPDEAAWLLDHHPEKLISVAKAILRTNPKKIIPLLLDKAVGDTRSLNSNTDHPLRLIQDWIKSGYPGSGEPILRRKALLDEVRDWWRNGGDVNVALSAGCYSLSPAFSQNEADPGSGMKITLTHGLILSDELSQIGSFWPSVLEFLSEASITNWIPIIEAAHDWVFPGRHVQTAIPEESTSTMERFAGQMLTDIAGIASDKPAAIRWVRRDASRLGIEIEMDSDDAFMVLFPYEDIDRWEESFQEHLEAVKALALKWSGCDPAQIAERLAYYEREAQSVGLTHPRFSPNLCKMISAQVEEPLRWAQALYDVGVPQDLVEPFLMKATSHESQAWALAEKCLGNRAYRSLAIEIALVADQVPDDFLEKVNSVLDEEWANFIMWLIRHDNVPRKRAIRLLHHKDKIIAAAVAVGIWYATPKGDVPDKFVEAWKRALFEGALLEYSLIDIFKSNSELALKWLAVCRT